MAKVKQIILSKSGQVLVPGFVHELRQLDDWLRLQFPTEKVISPNWLRRDLDKLHALENAIVKAGKVLDG